MSTECSTADSEVINRNENARLRQVYNPVLQTFSNLMMISMAVGQTAS